jgi:hypothetical protein
MQAISLETTENRFIISIDREVIGKDVIFRLLNRLRLEYLVQKIDISEEAINELSEEIKNDWWEKNKATYLP